MADIHQIEVTTIDGEKTTLGQYQGKVMLIVNVASECGLTPHYRGLQALHNEYQDLVVLGFPSNQFGGQEPGTDEEIKTFCELKYQVKFPMFAKIEVNGDAAHPLYQYLKNQKQGEEQKDIEWNFAKFLVSKSGEVDRRFHPKVEPAEMKDAIESLLKN